VLFGRNRESRNREAAGRRNWPEAVPRKCGRKKVDRPKSVKSPQRRAEDVKKLAQSGRKTVGRTHTLGSKKSA
jgi:hypothetical protein